MQNGQTDFRTLPNDGERREKLSRLKLNKQQQDAVLKTDGAVLLLAVPGSGKTTVLTARLGYMINRLNISPGSILVLTYTVAAANEMKRRFIELYAESDGEIPEFRTINGVAQKIINDFSRRTGRVPFNLLANENRTSSLIASVVKDVTGDFPTESAVSEVRSLITRVKNSMLGREQLLALGSAELPFAEIFEKYQAWLKENRLMDYDDQLVYALTILKKYPEIRRAYTERYKYICVDEAQDTSEIQHCIIKLLTENNGNIFMVGDEDQSIYGFRGAAPQFLLDFKESYPGAFILKSEENFRSVSEIVSPADSFINRNTLRIKKHMTAARGERGRLNEIKCFDIPAQYKYLAKILEKNTVQTAVLFRNNECALPLIDLLLRSGTDFSCRDTDCAFFTSRTFTDVTSILSLAENGADTDSFMKIYYRLGLFLPKTAAVRICAEAYETGESIFMRLLTHGGLTVQAEKKCERIISTLQRIKTSPLPTAVFLAAHLTGLGDGERKTDPFKTEILMSLASREKNITTLLARLDELKAAVGSGAKGSGMLTLSTIHSAKGLEFDRVFIINAADGVLPANAPQRHMTKEEIAAYEEERRLFYVAATRAKNELNIFSFSSDKYDSSFADELFGRRVPPEIIPVANRIPKTDDGAKEVFVPAVTKKSASAAVRNMKKGFTVDARSGGNADCDSVFTGSAISHKSFGDGTVTARNGDVITAQFVNGKICRFSLSHLLRSKLASFGTSRRRKD